jgi:diaminopimelate epimerase
MSELRFAKYHGTGNDFVIIEDPEDRIALAPGLVAALCDRRFGVGGDGLIRVTGPEGAAAARLEDQAAAADFFMDYYNADGATAEMCGNGVRCLAKLVYERGLTDKTELAVATRGGLKRVWFEAEGGAVGAVTVDMGAPAFRLADIPMEGAPDDTFLTEPFEHDGMSFKASAVSMGNPHLVLFVDRDPDAMDVGSIGPALEHDSRFPNRTNVEFLAPSEGGVKVRVWERGVGETMACGTGACASLVAAHLAGLVPRRSQVHFPGGTLDLDWLEDGPVQMTGPAERVFEGTLDPERLLAGRSPTR